MGEAIKGKRGRRNREQWRLLLARFSSSGLSVGAFCQREAISSASFYRWRKLLEGASPDRRESLGGSPGQFVDLGEVELGSATPRGRIEIRLDLGDGLVLQVVRR
jgi:putative transposase